MRARWWLCLSALAPYVLDVALTLIGQPAAYWAGAHDSAQEANPLAAWLMRAGPAVFGLAAGLWAVVFGVLLLFWRNRLVWPLAFVLALVHGVGAATWMVGEGWEGYIVPILYLVLVERLVRWCWRRAQPAVDSVSQKG
jgi:hypothetical protein